jgi:hypothetical protein
VRPDVTTVRAFLARVARRLAVLSAAEGAAYGFAAAIGLALFGWPHRDDVGALIAVGVAAGLCGALVVAWSRAGHRRHVAAIVERRVPASRNLILTAHELSDDTSARYVPGLVFSRAARLVETLDPATLFPARNALLALVAILVVWAFVVDRPALPMPAALRHSSSLPENRVPTIDGVDVTVEPPAYTGRTAQRLRDPSRIEALTGSKITLSVHAQAGRVVMETLASRDTLSSRGSAFIGSIAADADGYIALQPLAAGRTGARRIVGLTVLPDAPPRVRIVTPGHDERFADGRGTLDIAIDASDDIALASLELRFTKVSGSGERFTFAEGKVPLAITRRDEKTWTARASWKLDSLALDGGDMVVYRAVAADQRARAGRPGGTTESDSYIAEIIAPGGIAAAGFALDPEQDRYAVSQEMVVLKTERLLGRRSSISNEDVSNESQQLAAEQRKVRAEFVFMLGGELADDPDAAASMTEINEEREAAGESDILAGRNANAGHVALLRAIRAMSRAAASLAVSEPTAALPYERTALGQLESAFSRSRILLRALTTRERLDLSRRLTGMLDDAVRDAQPSAEPARSSRALALRRALSEIATLDGTASLAGDAATRASSLAERVIAIDPSSRALQDVGAQLASSATAMASHRGDAARAALDRATMGLVAMLRSELLDAPRAPERVDDARLEGALADQLRAASGARRPR